MYQLSSVGEKIKVKRKELKMTQIEFSEGLGVSQGTLSEIESGKTKPSFEMLVTLADKLKSTSNSYVRAHWNAGAGLFQLDSAGLGANVSLKDAIYSDTSSGIVAAKVATAYKNSSASTAKNKRAAAWNSWYACDDGTCETIFNDIYNSTSDTLYITRDYTVSRSGGLETKTCAFTHVPGPFTCYKYNADNAQGHKGSWYYTPYNGNNTSMNPVPLPFYVYMNGNYEYREWSTTDTGYAKTIYKYRKLGDNARSNSNWAEESRGFYAY